VTRLVVSVDQLYRPQPGGIGSYVRGLLQGLATLDGEWEVRALAPRGRLEQALGVSQVTVPLDVAAMTHLWRFAALGVPATSDVVHATSLAGPFGGGRRGAVHSVAVHDVLWRDRPEATTRRGVAFHEARLHLLRRRESLRVFTTSPGLADRLASEGIAPSRVHYVRLGVDDAVPAADAVEVTSALAREGVRGPFTLYVGTREPRKNLTRLIAAHGLARRREPGLGPLVLVGPAGWGAVDTADAVVLGARSRALVKGLLRDATVMAYVAIAEGWGLPPVEALYAGTRVVAGRDVPSVGANREVVVVDPFDESSITEGLVRAYALSDDASARERRRASVADQTWARSAADHVAGWR
jgi:glycosyltransferase involved in cell wall biosynthesis